MWHCIRSEMVRINKREQELRDLVHGVTQPLPVAIPEPPLVAAPSAATKPMTQYI